MNEFAKWLKKQFLEFEYKSGERQTQETFANHLDVKAAALSHWMTGKRLPDPESTKQLAAKLGDDVYQAVAKAYWDVDIEILQPQ